MTPAEAHDPPPRLLQILACILAGLILGSLLMAFLRSSEAAGNWIGELVYLIRHGI